MVKSNENIYDKNDIEKSRKQMVMRKENIEEADSHIGVPDQAFRCKGSLY